jgi:hypothetical protein
MSVWFVLTLIVCLVGALLFAVFRAELPKTPAHSDLSARCPVCSGTAVIRTGKTYECANCHSALKITFTLRALWAIPVTLLTCAVALLAIPLHRTGWLSGVWLAAVIGGLSSLGFSLAMRMYMRGLAYSVAKPRNPT